MTVNPHAWFSTLPLTILLVAVYFQPSDNVLKRWWGELRRLEGDVWLRLAGADVAPGSAARHLQRAAYWGLVAFCAVGSVFSLVAYAGAGPL